MAYFTYILFSEKASRYYYGQTNDLTKRLNRHNAGQVRSTKYATPWSLFAWKETLNRKEAIRLEKMLKNIHSTKKLSAFLSRHEFQISKYSQEVTGPEK
jgi:putative endonuclease